VKMEQFNSGTEGEVGGASLALPSPVPVPVPVPASPAPSAPVVPPPSAPVLPGNAGTAPGPDTLGR
jgi:hypothetical protein